MPRWDSNTKFPRTLRLGVALLLCAANVQAAGAPIPHGTLELIAENQSIAAGHELYLGLHFQLEKGWHIYWVNPGDSGEPPRIKWQLPPDITVGEIEWPTPRRLGTPSIVDFGYEDEVTLIVPIHAQASLASQQSAQIGAEVKVLACREICIPGKAQLSLTLPVESRPTAPDARNSGLFTAARKSLPRPAPRSWKFSVADANNSFVLTANLGHQVSQAVFFPLAESQIDNAVPQKLLSVPSGLRLTLRKSDQLRKPIARLKGVLVLSAAQAYIIDVPLGSPGAAENTGAEIYAAQFLEEVPRR